MVALLPSMKAANVRRVDGSPPLEWTSKRRYWVGEAWTRIPWVWNFWVTADSSLTSIWKSTSSTGCMTRADVLLIQGSCSTPAGTLISSRASSVPLPVRAKDESPTGSTKLHWLPSAGALKSSETNPVAPPPPLRVVKVWSAVKAGLPAASTEVIWK